MIPKPAFLGIRKESQKMFHRGAFFGVILLTNLATCDLDTSLKQAVLDSRAAFETTSETVRLVCRNGRTLDIAPNSLRTRFCLGDEDDSCYDYALLFVQLDNCGVTAYPLSSIFRFESTGGLSPAYCIKPAGSAKLSTATEQDRRVFVQEGHWSWIGREVGSGERVTVPFDEVADFRRVSGP